MKYHVFFENPQDGEIRTIRRFALFPICTLSEMRWMEWVTLQQKYSRNYADDGWHNERFLDEK
jgi:hypothetical protein